MRLRLRRALRSCRTSAVPIVRATDEPPGMTEPRRSAPSRREQIPDHEPAQSPLRNRNVNSFQQFGYRWNAADAVGGRKIDSFCARIDWVGLWWLTTRQADPTLMVGRKFIRVTSAYVSAIGRRTFQNQSDARSAR